MNLPTPKQLVRTAMLNRPAPRVPVFCQMAIGHTLLGTGVDPVAFNFTNLGFARGLLKIRELYDFDGILIHKPGRDDSVLERTERVETPQGPCLQFADGGRILCTPDDDPKYFPPAGWRCPGFAPAGTDPLAALAEMDLDHPLAGLPPSYVDWCLHKGQHYFMRPQDFPEFYFGATDLIVREVGEKISVHGEVKAPLDYLINMLGIDQTMMGLLLAPELCHRVMDRATQAAGAWAAAQLARGCEAIKISSPYAGGGFISRQLYQEFVVPHERTLVEMIHAAGGIAYTHTCGAIGDRLDLMVQTGIDGIETLDPPPLGNVDLAQAKQLYGERIFFKGNLDSVNVLLRGDEACVTATVLECLRAGTQCGGFILSTACSVAPRVPPENIRLMVRLAREFSQANV